MSRWLRYIPRQEEGQREVVEITARCVNSIFLLQPSKRWNALLCGILGRAQRLTGVEIHNLDYESNHCHFQASVMDAYQLADFMKRAQQQTSVELRIRRKWSGPAWEGPYKLSYPGRKRDDLVRRFRYILAQGCAAGLVSSPRKWPGVNAAKALCAGKFELEGVWVDHTALGRAKRRRDGKKVKESDFTTREKVVLTKLPGFEDLSDEEYCDFVRGLVKEIEKETREGHKKANSKPMGAWRVLRMSPYRRPKEVSWGARPRVTASDKDERSRLLTSLFTVFDEYEKARERQRAGDLEAKFPVGTFPSPLPFVGLQAQRAGP